MSMFTLAISCLTTSNLPWLMDLTFQVPMQYCSLQHWTLLLSPATSTTGCCFVLATSLHSFWSYFSTNLQWQTGHLPVWGVHLSVSYLFAFSYCSWGSQGKNTKVVCHSLLQGTTFCHEWKRCPFHYRGLECKSRKSRNTWRNRQIWAWTTEWSRAKANIALPRKRTGHSKHPLPTTQEKTLHMDITRWSTPKSDRLYSLQPKTEKLYTVSKNKTGSWLWLGSWTPYCQIQT